MKKAVVILSGGMDSTTLLYDIKNAGKFDKIYALTFDYGQKHVKEIEAAKATCKKLGIEQKIVDIFQLGKELLFKSSLTGEEEVPEGHYAEENMKSTVVPNRNMILLSLAAGYAISVGAQELFYGAHAGDHTIYPDCRPEFISAMQDVLKLCDWTPVMLRAPYSGFTKGDIAVRGKTLNVDYGLTWTCYKGAEKPCGKCGSCTEREEAFLFAEMPDPLTKD